MKMWIFTLIGHDLKLKLILTFSTITYFLNRRVIQVRSIKDLNQALFDDFAYFRYDDAIAFFF